MQEAQDLTVIEPKQTRKSKKDSVRRDEKQFTANKGSLRKYLVITILTGGIGIIYWLYKIINMYNMHFIEQEKIEREINNFLREH